MDGVSSPYIPTQQEALVTLARGDFLKLSGDGVFATLQGEGMTAGTESVFLRLQNCNLHCGANGQGWSCDTWYTWDKTRPEYWQETTNVPVEEVAERVREAWADSYGAQDTKQSVPNLVITGGEPLLQQRRIVPLLRALPGWTVEIETNGTIAPREELENCQINCSPKLESSGNPVSLRRRMAVLESIAKLPNHWFKFVITQNSFEQDIAEVQELFSHGFMNPDRVLLMCEGSDAQALRENHPKVALVARELGFTAVERHHVFWFGNKRRT
jgi:organic radical activating enzyme